MADQNGIAVDLHRLLRSGRDIRDLHDARKRAWHPYPSATLTSGAHGRTPLSTPRSTVPRDAPTDRVGRASSAEPTDIAIDRALKLPDPYLLIVAQCRPLFC